MRPFLFGDGVSQSTLEFRPDIEGLRGIAVLLVLLAHAGVPGFSGGFVGVDIFFVISGYLITRMLRLELDRNGRLDFSAFYARRIKRLLPALLLMLAVVTVACQWMLPVNQQMQQAHAGYWAALWASNVYFAFAQIDYFGDDAIRNVFTHTWSLGVEEQFYLLWPLMLTMFWRPQNRFVLWVTGVGVVSLLSCLWMAAGDANAAYYLMPTRLWQLAAGALAGTVGARKGPWAALGIAVGCLMVMGIDGQSAYPSVWALLPVTGAVFVLLGDPLRPGLAVRLIANVPLRFVGRISYSLYLWHWPILVLVTSLWPKSKWWSIAAALALSFVIAAISERWIERPFRRAKWQDQRVIVGGLLATLVLILIMGFWRASVSLTDQVPRQRQGQSTAPDLLAGRINLPAIYETPGFDDYYLSDRFLPVLAVGANRGSGKRALLAGDSILMQWEPAVSAIAREQGWRLVAATKSACPMLDASYVNGRIRRRFVECERWREALVAHVQATKPEILILGSAATYPFDDATWIDGTRALLSRVQGAAGKIVIFAPTPRLPFRPLDCVSASGRIVNNRLVAPDCAAPLSQASQSRITGLLIQATRNMSNVKVVTLDSLVCPGGECAVVDDGQVVFRDEAHLNASFVLGLQSQLSSLLGQAEVR